MNDVSEYLQRLFRPEPGEWLRASEAAAMTPADSPLHPWDVDSFEFPLDKTSIVIELGGFHGRWALEIARRYNPHLYVYEPQEWLYDELRQKLTGYNAEVFGYGLGVENAVLPMGEYGTDGCSFMPAGRRQGTGRMREWYAELEARGITGIDLLLMNIEGYENVLLPYVLPMVDRIRWLMVQFHVDVTDPAAARAYLDLRERLGRAHHLRFDYGLTLACWERND